MNDMQPRLRPAHSAVLVLPGMSDSQLLELFNAGGDEAAETSFAALVHRHGPMVWRVCLQIVGDRHCAEDAFQATFLVLARRSRAIRRPELLGNWLYGVALRTAREARGRLARGSRYLTTLTADLGDAPPADAIEPVTALIRCEEAEAVHEEVERLPERYRLAVVLCELQGMTYQEAAQRLQCPVATVGVRLTRARERLRVRLVRRGILPAAAALDALLGAEGASMWVPAVLVRATVGTALRCPAVHPAIESDASLAIARAVLKAMSVAPRLKGASYVVSTVGLSAVLGHFAMLHPVRDQVEPTARAAETEIKGPPVVALVTEAQDERKVPTNRDASDTVEGDPETDDGNAAIQRADEESGRIKRVAMRRAAEDERVRGHLLFAKEWAVNDPLSRGGDGLGPVYNETSCVACHGLGGPGGGGPNSKNVVIITATPSSGRSLPKGLERVHPGFRDARSTVLHRFGTDPAYGPWRMRFLETQRTQDQNGADEDEPVEARIRKAAELAALTRRRGAVQASLKPMPGVILRVTERNTPAIFGAGAIDAIPTDVIEEFATQQPAAVRGRVGRDRDGMVGRFGWKAQVASLHEFVRTACAGELGLEVAGHSQSRSPLTPDDTPKGPDMSEPDCDALVAYVRALPAPVVADPAGPQGNPSMMEGRRLFAGIGCASCHSPSLGEVRGIYSDLLLHDMGPGLSDSGIYYGFDGPTSPGGPSPGEWRTPPLWGFRDSGPYLHDGRADTLIEAVALHGGQSASSAKAFFELSAEQQSQVEAFLKSLVAPSLAPAPGIALASELEQRLEPEDVRKAEAEIRKEREEAAALERKRRLEAKRQREAADAAHRALVQYPIAQSLERMGKTSGAMQFYQQIVRDAPDTAEARKAAERIAELRKGDEAR